ncbi:hypothetical protein [Spirillospora sp. CA-294931]|uniref:hypothetical protein n=1 Tax=Spirillospora sp. CA-294931 TaxID=3240042 RepID=UPI003D8C7889
MFFEILAHFARLAARYVTTILRLLHRFAISPGSFRLRLASRSLTQSRAGLGPVRALNEP